MTSQWPCYLGRMQRSDVGEDDWRVAVIGAGALGCAVLMRLRRLKPGTVIIIDGDRVEEGNLGRQALYRDQDVGSPKAAVAARRVAAEHGLRAQAVDRFFTGHVAEPIGHCDAVVDCTDDLHAKDAIDRACARDGVPLLSAGVHGAQGQVMLLHAPGQDPGLSRRAYFNGRIGEGQDGCDMRQVLPEVIEATAERIEFHLRALRSGQPCPASLELYDHAARAWYAFGTLLSA